MSRGHLSLQQIVCGSGVTSSTQHGTRVNDPTTARPTRLFSEAPFHGVTGAMRNAEPTRPAIGHAEFWNRERPAGGVRRTKELGGLRHENDILIAFILAIGPVP